ncbi:type 2 lanthipeptide synthetase LanM family protein [Streptomyces sp. NPDC001135]
MGAPPDAAYRHLSETAAWAAAQSLAERTASGPPPASHPQRAATRMDAWGQLAAFRGSPGSVEANLRALGTDAATLRRVLGEDPAHLADRLAADGTGHPAWLRAFTSAHRAAPGTYAYSGPVFPRIAEPLICRATARLRTALSDDGPGGPAGVADALCATVPLARLDAMLAPAMILEINLARVAGRLSGRTPQERFASFTGQLTDPGFRSAFWSRYPVLARQATEALETWVHNGLRFARRLRADLPEISRTLLAGHLPTGVRGLSFGLGDPHRGGQSVCKVEFTDDGVVMYKPRPLGVEAAFAEVLARFHQESGIPVRVPRLLDRSDYGWVEYLSPAPCRSTRQVAVFYHRMGAALAMVHAFRGTDLHHENVIAVADQPVLVDLEALFHPADHGVSVWAEDPRPGPADLLFHDSVLSTGLLPGKTLVSEEGQPPRVTDLSGISGAEGQPWVVPLLVPENAGTDRMRLVSREVEVAGTDNRPRLADGSPVDPAAFVADLLAGFRTGYRWLCRHRDELLAPGGMVERFATTPVRYLHRATAVYEKVLRESYHPDFVSDALDRERSVARLCSGWRGAPGRERIVRGEMDALLAGDVPAFRITPGTRDLHLDNGETVPDFLASSPLSQVRAKLRAMGPDDMARQEWIITTSFAGLSASGRPRMPRLLPHRRTGRGGSAGEPGAGALIDAAGAIGDRLIQLSATSGERVGWLGTRAIAEGASAIAPVGVDLYSGLSGIGLFFLRLSRITGKRRFHAYAERVADEVVRRVTDEREQRSRDGQPAGPQDIGPGLGALYFMSHDRRLGGHRDRFTAVRDAVVPCLAGAIAQDRRYDILDGSAGWLLALLAAHSVHPDPELLALARLAGQRLLTGRTVMERGAAWHHTAVAGTRPLTGLAHGTSGIALALSRLEELVPDRRHVEAITQALAYEASTYSRHERNWPDLRDGVPDRFRSSWCHGAAGMAMVRTEFIAAPYLADAVRDLRAEVVDALPATRASRANHSLCHGDLGNLELLLLAERAGLCGRGQFAGAPKAALEGARRTGWRCGTPDGEEVPGLFTGIAGIGYNLLRMAAPESVPSVLLVQPPEGP